MEKVYNYILTWMGCYGSRVNCGSTSVRLGDCMAAIGRRCLPDVTCGGGGGPGGVRGGGEGVSGQSSREVFFLPSRLKGLILLGVGGWSARSIPMSCSPAPFCTRIALCPGCPRRERLDHLLTKLTIFFLQKFKISIQDMDPPKWIIGPGSL